MSEYMTLDGSDIELPVSILHRAIPEILQSREGATISRADLEKALDTLDDMFIKHRLFQMWLDGSLTLRWSEDGQELEFAPIDPTKPNGASS